MSDSMAAEVNRLAQNSINLEQVSEAFNIADALSREIIYVNDEASIGFRGDDGKWRDETDEERYLRVRRWVSSEINEVAKS